MGAGEATAIRQKRGTIAGGRGDKEEMAVRADHRDGSLKRNDLARGRFGEEELAGDEDRAYG